MRRPGSRSWIVAAIVCALALAVVGEVSAADSKLRVIVIVPFDTTALEREEQWMGEGVAQILALGLAQQPSIVQIERSRLKAAARVDAWNEQTLAQAARAVRADAGLFGRIERRGTDLAVVPQLLEIKQSGPDVTSLEPVVAPAADLFQQLGKLPVAYARTLRVSMTEADAARIEKSARPTRLPRAFELFARGQIAAQRGDQEGNEAAVDLLSRAIEVDPSFVVATYMLGVVHSSLGNRWKAAAQFRASTQLDASYPEPAKALGDLYLSQPRRLFDQAVEAYSKAIELRPFYADAYVGLGDAKAAKSDVDGAIAAYQKALVYNPVNPRVHMSLGKIYYGEKGLYYEAVTAYKKAIELDSNSVDARMGLGEVYEEKGLYKEATEEYRKVIEIDGKHTGAMYNLALVYEKVDPKAAITQWERYIELAAPLATEKDWVDVARQHLRKLKNQVKD
ncbi:MAG TPA: tetratricopeptide repeat protein [Methylomirabilota bacterium]|jgi:tetratricopeptide (TPR) repeat protein|nr:tetratricopeptide repeat protein [Methylomirabilota bacterium]